MEATAPDPYERVFARNTPSKSKQEGPTMRLVRPGTHVEVRSRFEQHWSRGFEIAEIVKPDSQYRVRRRSDGSVLPVLFDEDDLREERRRSTWWQSEPARRANCAAPR